MTPGWIVWALAACLPTLDEKADDTASEEVFTCVVYEDADGDGYGNGSVYSTEDCENIPSGWVDDPWDCDDDDPGVNPGAV